MPLALLSHCMFPLLCWRRPWASRRSSVWSARMSPHVQPPDAASLRPSGLWIDHMAIPFGVLPVSAQIHERVRIIAGRMFAPGLNEVIIGKLLVHRYPGCSLGADLKLGRRTWKVVGVFESGGSPLKPMAGAA